MESVVVVQISSLGKIKFLGDGEKWKPMGSHRHDTY